MPGGYSRALRETLRTTAAAYGYTLGIATTITVLQGVHGKPTTGDLFLFIAGGLAAFACLEAVLLGSSSEDSGDQGQQFPFAGALNIFSAPAALGSSVGIAHGVHSGVACRRPV
jgi:hypothetical protein